MVNSTKLRRRGLLAAGVMSVALLAPTTTNAAGDHGCMQTGPGVDRSPTKGDTPGLVTPWGETAIQACSPLEVSPIGRKH